MSVNGVSNTQAMTDALKYIQGVGVSEEETSILKDAAGSVFNPIQLIFAATGVNGALKTATDSTKLKEIPKNIKNFPTLEKGTQYKEFLRSTNVKDQFTNSADYYIKQADKKAADKLTKAKQLKADVNSGSAGIFKKAKFGIKKAGSSVKGLLSKIPGASKVSSLFSKIGGTKVGKIVKGTGAAGMMIFEGISGIITDVIPAFQQGGASAGFKQLGKTAVSVAATGAGWAAGSCAATAIGAAIGSVFPGVGTVIGGAIGTAIGGFLGSSIFTGIANKILGKSETEKIQDEQFEEAGAQVAQDSASVQELGAYVAQQVQADIESGNVTEDTEKMVAYLQSGAFGNISTGQYTGTGEVTGTTTDTTTGTTTDVPASTNWVTEAAYRIQNGDTSMYNISDDKLNTVFASPSSVPFTSNTTQTTNTMTTQEVPMNFYA